MCSNIIRSFALVLAEASPSGEGYYRHVVWHDTSNNYMNSRNTPSPPTKSFPIKSP